MTNEQKDKLWRDGLPHLHYVPHAVRVAAIQAGIQTWGPVPNDLGNEARRLMDPSTPIAAKSQPVQVPVGALGPQSNDNAGMRQS
jgi:hypothetical protein